LQRLRASASEIFDARGGNDRFEDKAGDILSCAVTFEMKLRASLRTSGSAAHAAAYCEKTSCCTEPALRIGFRGRLSLILDWETEGPEGAITDLDAS
jgi:hypothetical protein